MNAFQTVLGAVLPIFLLIGIGLLIRKLNWLTEEADQSLLRVNINLLLPCLIFDAATGNPALARLDNLLLPPVVGFATMALGVAAGWLVARGLRFGDPPTARTFALSVGLYNYGYVPLPLSLLLFGKETAGVLFVHNVGVELGIWTLGVMLLTGRRPGANWRQILNAPLIAIAVAVTLNAGGGERYVPELLLTAIHWLGACAVPMALVLIGAVVADHLHEFHSATGWRTIVAAVLLRNGLLPVAFLALAAVLPVSIELKRVLLLQAAMPSAVFPILLARHYGGDPPTALRVIISTSLAGLLTIPLWIRFGMRLLNFAP
ncbi:MAG: AEC family transporter [Verrucomicrobiae bacterium]|nr:AEC family transporter [Verrucomicrobiae bacterium]MDW8307921.1 AEC family transporter [Verrucomicrobiales bacterium]